MASHITIFRITINSKKRLSINIEEPGGSRQFSADFGYSDALVQQIATFQQKARQKNPTDLSSEDIRQLGEQLFQAIFDKNLQMVFEELHKKVQASNGLLRVELDIDEEYLPQVAAIPWEFMRPKNGTAVLLCASPYLILSRRPRLHMSPPQIKLSKEDKIRILLVASYPGSDQNAVLGPVLHQPVYDALKKLADAPKSNIELYFSDNAQLKELDHLLKVHKPHVFHFIGTAVYTSQPVAKKEVSLPSPQKMTFLARRSGSMPATLAACLAKITRRPAWCCCKRVKGRGCRNPALLPALLLTSCSKTSRQWWGCNTLSPTIRPLSLPKPFTMN
ncbi:hypothetical protein MNBD_CHLOROFLEXI01-354 [hydrothermal vent metagenome]|uniref:Uncharacterized protein n=1 Tax=hydrothermal vent metagenome TaxID=652676 RepID=A0A3B0VT20_9ZZZZ